MREIKFRGLDINGNWYYGLPCHIQTDKAGHKPGWYISNSVGISTAYNVRPETVTQFTGLTDKNGKAIYEGDIVRIKKPYRQTQTHTGDNIPNGSYSEPMEAGIKTEISEVKFENGYFGVTLYDDYQYGYGDKLIPLWWEIFEYDLESIQQAISYGGSDRFVFDDPEEGDLQYLMELENVTTPEELCQRLSGLEVLGNIYQNPELLNP